ncbi:MAG: calcium/sodium antiporter [Elusimicrobia bacterium]|nr:calcium/sodium antiporter [Elusimicrobiota bacterium]
MIDSALLLLGIACAATGGELFVRGAVGLARRTGLSPALIGATVAAFATSSPELSVAIGSALAREPQISLGDAFGSNVVNVALILGLGLSLSGIKASRIEVRREVALALLVQILLGIVILDGRVSRGEGFFLLCVFAGWLAALIRGASKNTVEVRLLSLADRLPVVLACNLAGLALLVVAGRLVVAGARGLAYSWGISEFMVGAILVSLGTSVPELATTLVAKLRKQDALGLGVVLGSNIFNGLFIVPVAALICPIYVSRSSAGVSLLFGAAAVTLLYPNRSGFVGRQRGFFLLALYVIYLVVLL